MLSILHIFHNQIWYYLVLQLKSLLRLGFFLLFPKVENVFENIIIFVRTYIITCI